MPLVLSQKPVITLEINEEKVDFIMLPYDQMEDELRRLLDTRYQFRGRQIRNEATKARIRFFDKCCYDIMNVVDDKGLPINRETNPEFHKLIPVNVKVSVSSQFEEQSLAETESEPESELEE